MKWKRIRDFFQKEKKKKGRSAEQKSRDGGWGGAKERNLEGMISCFLFSMS